MDYFGLRSESGAVVSKIRRELAAVNLVARGSTKVHQSICSCTWTSQVASWVGAWVSCSLQVDWCQDLFSVRSGALIVLSIATDLVAFLKIIFLVYLLVAMIWWNSCCVLEKSHQVWLDSVLVRKLQQSGFSLRVSGFQALMRGLVEVVDFSVPLAIHIQII